ncbi:MBL fold metallo-hydrolase, partial [Candidatus Kaiserbacteria bacterium]|nr:MBL fold metallo-hydrolase [Candidatus Kaiserbacteria bacterium]
MDRFVRIRLVILLPSLLCAALVWIVQLTAKVEVSHDFLVVRFLDVGQGDAVHIVTPDGYEMLVDGGATAGVLRELAQGQSFFDREIDVLVATHPDTDHIGGLVDVLGRYDVDIIIETEAQSESPAALAYAKAAALEGAEIKIAQAGQKIKLGASTTIEIYSPQGDTTNWENNS